jgi:hypothetical protein
MHTFLLVVVVVILVCPLYSHAAPAPVVYVLASLWLKCTVPACDKLFRMHCKQLCCVAACGGTMVSMLRRCACDLGDLGTRALIVRCTSGLIVSV